MGNQLQGFGISALTVFDDALIAGSHFTLAPDGTGALNIARWDGVSWHALGSGVTAEFVSDMTVFNGELMVSGRFYVADGNGLFGILRRDGASWQPLSSEADFIGLAMTVYQNDLVVAGEVLMPDGYEFFVQRWDGSSWQRLGSEMNDAVSALTVYNNELIAGGYFTFADGHQAKGIARWDGASWQPIGGGFVGGEDEYSAVDSMTVFGGELIAAGHFVSADGVPAKNIARWDGTEWKPLGSGIDSSYVVYLDQLTVYNDELIVGGLFESAGGINVSHIARWNGKRWLGLEDGLNNQVFCLGVYNGELIAGGVFTMSGGTFVGNIARWNGTAWSELQGAPALHAEAITVRDGELVAAGVFFIAGGHVSAYSARWGPSCRRGDMNCDKVVDEADLQAFAYAILDPEGQSDCIQYLANMTGDVGSDGTPKVNGEDIASFVAAYLGQ
jgi:hypothetical protein